MTKEEKMHGVHLYDPNDDEVRKFQNERMDKLHRFNKLSAGDVNSITKMMKEMLGDCGENCYITPPFYSNFGGKHVHFGNNIYCNFGCTFVDDTHIYVGDNTMFGPNVTIATAGHPIDPELRKQGLQYNAPVRIGKNCWIGAGVIIVPGVTIGDNVVIGAGSIVTKDIPSNVVAFGNPCKVHREIGENDKIYFFKDKKIKDEDF